MYHFGHTNCRGRNSNMICRECGTEAPAESVYCPQCGARLNSAEPAGLGVDDPPASRSRLAPASPGRHDAVDDDRETELWEGGYSSKAMIGHWIGAGVLSVVLLLGGFLIPGVGWVIAGVGIPLLWVLLGLLLAYRKLNVRYRLTNQRFVHRSGILRQVTDRIEVIDMDDITFVQGLVDRFLGVGTIKVTSSDKTHPEIYLQGIEDVQKVAGLIDNARRQERVRRGLHIEAV